MLRPLLFIAVTLSMGVHLPAYAAEAPPPSPNADLEQLVNQAERLRKVIPNFNEPIQSATVSDVLGSNPIKLGVSISEQFPVITQDLTLEQAVSIALRESPAIKAATEALAGTRWLVRSARARLGPSVSVSTFLSQSSIDQMQFFIREQVDPPPMQPVTKGGAFHVIIAGYQPLFASGRLINAVRAASARGQAADANALSQRLTGAQDVKVAYWDAVLAREQLLVSTDYAKYRATSAENMRRRVEVGKVPRADLLREEAEISRAGAEVNERYRAYNTALVRLKSAQGISLLSMVTVADALDKPLPIRTLDEYMTLAKSGNPAIRTADSKVREASANRAVVASRFGPQAGLYGLVSNSSGNVPGEMESVRGRWGGTIGLMAGMTLFSSGERLFELRNANALLRQARLERDQALLRAQQDLAIAWIDFETTSRNIELSQAELAFAQEDQRLMHARYLIGKAIALEDFDATVRWHRARLALVERIYAQKIAIAKLEAIAGII